MPIDRAPYSYRTDPAVPSFPDDRPLIVFDGVCVLCSAFARFVLRRDRTGVFRLTTAQSTLGQALLRHYGLATVAFETNLVIADGRAHAKLDAFAAVMRRLPGPWPVLAASGWLPGGLGDRLYDVIARNRYRVFGRYDRCVAAMPGSEGRFLG